MIKDVSCAILAGGKSRRMGVNKAFIPLGKRVLFDYVYDICRELFSQVIIVTNQPGCFVHYNAQIVTDIIREMGALGGIYSALMSSANEHTLCVACDMPFLKATVIRYLLEKRVGHDLVIPVTKYGLEPLHAIYSKACIAPIRGMLARGILQVSGLLAEVNVYRCTEDELRKLDPSLESFINVNTKQDLVEIESMLRVKRCAGSI